MESEFRNSPFCPSLSFFRRSKSKLRNVYSIREGEIVSTKRRKERDLTYKCDKYRPSIDIDDTSTIQSIAETSEPKNFPIFISELEENARKIESMFSKCSKPGKNCVSSAMELMLEHTALLAQNSISTRDRVNCTNDLEERSGSTCRTWSMKSDGECSVNSSVWSVADDRSTASEEDYESDGYPDKCFHKGDKNSKETTNLQSVVDSLLKMSNQSMNLNCTDECKLSTNNSFSKGHSLDQSSVCGTKYTNKETGENDKGSVNDINSDPIVNHQNRKSDDSLQSNAPSSNSSLSDLSLIEMDNLDARIQKYETLFKENLKYLTLDRYNSSFDLSKTASSLQYGTSRTSTDHLDSIVVQMRDVSEKKKQLEKDHLEALANLRDKQNELQWKSNCSSTEKVKLCENIEALQSKIRELEKKLELQNMHHEELMLEMAAAKRANVHRQSLPSSPYASSMAKKKSFSHEDLSPDTAAAAGLHPNKRDAATGSNEPYWNYKYSHYPVSTYDYEPSPPVDELPPMPEKKDPQKHYTHPNSKITSVDIDKIMQKIDQDNRVLAELDKTRSTIAAQGFMTAEQMKNISDMGIVAPPLPQTCQPIVPMMQSSGLPMNMTRHTISSMPGPSSLPSNFSSFLPPEPFVKPNSFQLPIQQQLARMPVSQSAFNLRQPTYAANLPDLSNLNLGSQWPLSFENHKSPYADTKSYSQIPQNFHYQGLDLDKPYKMWNHRNDLKTAYSALMHDNPLASRLSVQNVKNGSLIGAGGFISSNDMLMSRDNMIIEGFQRQTQDMVDVPGKGLCHVYITKFNYDPFSQSTGTCPEAELTINTGDYLLVYGLPNDEGYVEAELMDGRRGLVPIIYIQKLSGDELLEFKRIVGMKESDDSFCTSIPQNIDGIMNTDEHLKKYRPEYNIGVTTEDEDEDVDESQSVPAPKQLTLERQLNKSILIRWNAPDKSYMSNLESYHVYVDGVLKATIKANERTKALLEGVDSSKPHRISVRSVTQNRRTSRDAACTMLIGKDVPQYPTNVRASHVTATSAVISWMPCNSNYQHTVCVNNVEVRTVKPSVYRHTITGLVPNTLYRVTVRTKNIRAPQHEDKPSDRFASHIDFRTLQKGMPDPPSDIQVDQGPQDNTLLVTWVPVTGESTNGALVTGYAVYADGKKVTEVDSPTGDHALIDISKLLSLNPRKISVRTKSKENQSCDSVFAPVPFSSSSASRNKTKKPGGSKGKRKNAYGQIIIDPDENLSDKEVYPEPVAAIPQIEITKEVVENYSEEEFYENFQSNRNVEFAEHPPSVGRGSSRGTPRNHAERGRPPSPQRMIGAFESRMDNKEHAEEDKSINKTGFRSIAHEGTASHPIFDKDGKLVVAIMDYDPYKSSPNPQCEEEISFITGDIIRVSSTIPVYCEIDPDGYLFGECRGDRGFVPKNFIVELEEAPPELMIEARNRAKYHLNYLTEDELRRVFVPYEVPLELLEMQRSGRYVEEDEYERQPRKVRVHRPRHPQEWDRGHGPGARGPPPPPREPPSSEHRDRRKDARAQYEIQQDQMRKAPDHDHHGALSERRVGRPEAGPRSQLRENVSTFQRSDSNSFQRKDSNSFQRSESNPFQRADSRTGSFRLNRTRNNPQSTPPQAAAKLPESPNIMQKLTEMTTSAVEHPVDNILSKGKELLFMKFGLGK